jgi:hypothetical protein
MDIAMQRWIFFFVFLLLSLVPNFSASAANIKISYTMVYDRIRPEPKKNVRVTNSFDVVLAEGGAVKEEINRAAGPFADNFKNKAKLGDGKWDVVSENQLRRTIEQPQSTLVLTITVNGKSCALEPKFTLKPGFNEYKFRRITDGTMAFFTEPKIQSTTCTIQ